MKNTIKTLLITTLIAGGGVLLTGCSEESPMEVLGEITPKTEVAGQELHALSTDNLVVANTSTCKDAVDDVDVTQLSRNSITWTEVGETVEDKIHQYITTARIYNAPGLGGSVFTKVTHEKKDGRSYYWQVPKRYRTSPDKTVYTLEARLDSGKLCTIQTRVF